MATERGRAKLRSLVAHHPGLDHYPPAVRLELRHSDRPPPTTALDNAALRPAAQRSITLARRSAAHLRGKRTGPMSRPGSGIAAPSRPNAKIILTPGHDIPAIRLAVESAWISSSPYGSALVEPYAKTQPNQPHKGHKLARFLSRPPKSILQSTTSFPAIFCRWHAIPARRTTWCAITDPGRKGG